MAIDKEKSFLVNNGLDVYHQESGYEVSGPFYTGGPDIPIGLNLPEETIYVQNKSDGMVIWRKFGNDINDWSVHDGLLRTDPANYDIKVPIGSVYQLFNREVNGELYVDGEVYII